MVIGMVSDKDLDSMLALMPKQAVYYFTNASVPRAMPALQFAEIAKQYDLRGMNYGTVKEAIKAAIRDASPKDMIFIGGSNFVVGDALPLFSK